MCYVQGQGTGLTGLRGSATFLSVCEVCIFRAQFASSLFLGLLVRTHSSEMTTGNKGDSSKRGSQRRGQLRGDGGAFPGEAAQAAQRGRRSAADSG